MNWQCWNHGAGRGWGMMHFGSPMMGLLLFGGMLLLVALALLWWRRRQNHVVPAPVASIDGQTPLEIAKHRLAAGEIDQAEFTDIRELLST